MARISIPVPSACVAVLFLLGTLPAQTTNEAGPPSEVSKVRIVRLSQVNGEVQLDRNTGRGYELALANLPIVEQSRLATGMGTAEVEFEDNSSLRIAPGSIVEFPQLDRLPDGGTASTVRLVKGTAYVSLLKTRGSEFNLLFGQQKLQLPPASHIRLQLDGNQATLAVLDGTVRIDGTPEPIDIPHKKTVTFNLLDQAQPAVVKDVVPGPYDSWDKNAAAFHGQSAATSFGSPYAYGSSDMLYYGAFMSMGGCGSMWRPYFASADWDPYANGIWAWYQGAGYSWVSPYPWGWTPFHFGSWSYCSGAGWGWQPGGSWNGLNNAIAFVPTGAAHPTPARPIRPPAPGAPTLTALNLKPLVRSQVVSGDSFVFRTDSAGLGIPRQGLGQLDKFSHSALTRGTATTPIYFPNGRSAGEGGAPGPIQRGSAQAPSGDRSSQSSAYSGGSRSSTEYRPEPANQAPRVSAPPPSSPPPAPAPSAAPSAPAAHSH